jgi:hypothetical protein
MNGSDLRIAIVSDLHAYESSAVLGDARPSYLPTDASETDPYQNPIAGLRALIEVEELRADVLLCCGDMGDQARPAATKYAWSQVNEIQGVLRAGLLVATAGNHDLDSRHRYNDYDARGTLQSLLPPFPLPESSDNDKYWARNYAIVERDFYRILVLNSSAYHGGPEKEFQHGRLSSGTFTQIQRELENRPSMPINVLLCHHHPYKHDDFPIEEYSQMKGGDALIALLGSGQHGRWLIVHGHKHCPRLCYAAGGIASPVVFSAGSLSAVLYPELQNRARNQFYLLDLPWTRFSEFELEIAGRFQAWDWIHAKGWQPATSRSGLPSSGGFGYRPEASVLAAKIKAGLQGKPFAPWDDILGIEPKLAFLTPDDLNVLAHQLAKSHSLELIRDEFGVVRQVGLLAGR